MHPLHVQLRFTRALIDLPAANPAAITFDEAFAIADSGEHRWHGPDTDQE